MPRWECGGQVPEAVGYRPRPSQGGGAEGGAPGVGGEGRGFGSWAGSEAGFLGRRGPGSWGRKGAVRGAGRGGGGARASRLGPGPGAGPGRGRRAAGRQGMASMAAAIAASRTAVMSANRPLDDRERKRFTYFSSLSPMARKIMQDKEKIREKYGPEWARLPPAQQDEIIDRCLVGPSASAPGDPEELARFPGLRGPTGQKVVRFGDEVGADGPASPPPLPGYTRRPRPGRHLPASSRPLQTRGQGLERRRRKPGG